MSAGVVLVEVVHTGSSMSVLDTDQPDHRLANAPVAGLTVIGHAKQGSVDSGQRPLEHGHRVERVVASPDSVTVASRKSAAIVAACQGCHLRRSSTLRQNESHADPRTTERFG